MEELGLQVFDAQGNMRPLQDIFEDLNGTLSTMTQGEQTQVLSELFNKVDLKSVNALMATNSERWAELSGAISDSAGAAQDMADVQLDNLAGDITILGSAWEGLQIAVRDAVDTQSGGLRQIVQFASDSISQVTEAIKNGGLVEGLKKIGEIAGETIRKIIDEIQSRMGDFVGLGTKILTWIADGFEKNFPTFQENWIKNLQNAINLLGENMPAILEAGGKIITTLVSGIEQSLPLVRETFVTLLSSFGGWVEENLPSLMESGLKLIVGFTASLRENIGPIIDAGLEFALSLARGIADGLPALIENIPTIISNIAGIINDNMPKILETGVKIIVTLAAGLIQAIPVIIENLPKIIMAIVDAFFAFNWMSLGESIITGIGNGIKNLITHIPDLFKSITDNSVNLVKSVNWADLGMSIIRFIGEGIQALFSAIPTALRTIGEEGFNLFRSIDWVGVGRSVIQFIGNGISALVRAIPDALVSIGKSAIEAFKGIDWAGLGKNIISGIVSGLKKNVDKVVNAITGIAGSALDAAKEFLGIASPSKKFRDLIGKPMAQGIAVGFTRGLPIKDMRDTLQNAMDFVSDIDMEDPFDDFGESLVNAAESFDINYPEDQLGIETIDIENDDNKRRIPIDQITFNIYPRESQDEQRIAEETMRIFTRWDEQQKAVYA